MRYLGSKAATAETILKIVSDRVRDATFCDPFGGIGVLGSTFKRNGFEVHCCDILQNANNFQVARIARSRVPAFRRLLKQTKMRGVSDVLRSLNLATQYSGWFECEYSIQRQFFTRPNARRIAGCRRMILAWDKEGWLTDSERAVLLASLVSSMDKVANTAGTYYAYLKNWYRKSLRPFEFRLISPTRGRSGCTSTLCDAVDLVASRKFDVLYLDPPYNDRCYSGYYHLPETIALQSTPRVKGMAGTPHNQKRVSRFNCRATATDALNQLIKASSFRLLILHYADDGLIPPSEIRNLLGPLGTLHEYLVGARGYSTGNGARTVNQRVYVVENA